MRGETARSSVPVWMKPIVYGAGCMVIAGGVLPGCTIVHDTKASAGYPNVPTAASAPFPAATPTSIQTDEGTEESPSAPYLVVKEGRRLGSFNNLKEALEAAKNKSGARIDFKKLGSTLWSEEPLQAERHIEAPLIYQMPELERGCEVTSLAMLLQQAGVDADKMTLAEEVKKDETPFEIVDHMIHFGNPNTGFVGDIATFQEPGLGVYHGPVKELAERYLPGRVVDATGAEFDDVLRLLQAGAPVWVIVNMQYQELDDDQFETWVTPEGMLDITYQEHSVLITGFDDEYVYFNDPLGEDERAERTDFQAAWEQMGRQAITYAK
ncbi:C39 family peptidase [Paenibacillus filicis]|uniref:C39 family peptidase n=1 Tax=Paenibacillus gyeongsangnamensis TaxID=3388067 RepID=A0ABT4QG94_9BACL|nr:C39 family peptidase [Paenibacillus filicis]MCZ8515885.1 C39 family peptidase [Paenibacillus filicis]